MNRSEKSIRIASSDPANAQRSTSSAPATRTAAMINSSVVIPEGYDSGTSYSVFPAQAGIQARQRAVQRLEARRRGDTPHGELCACRSLRAITGQVPVFPAQAGIQARQRGVGWLGGCGEGSPYTAHRRANTNASSGDAPSATACPYADTNLTGAPAAIACAHACA